MAKFSLTESGVAAFTAHFYKFSDDKLQGEAILLAGDPRAYIMTHFEMPVHQLEFLRSLNDTFLNILGWSLAIALLSRKPITFCFMNDAAGISNCKDTCILSSSQFSHHVGRYAISSTGKLAIQVQV